MYYLTLTARRKNAKRHIELKSNDLNYLRQFFVFDSNYIAEIYDGRWNLIERRPD